MALRDVAVNLRLNISNFGANLTHASKMMRDFSKVTNSTYGNAAFELGKHNLKLKDTARIIQGILVSQAFYSAARSIREATSSLTEFNEKLDYAKVTYSALFGSTDLANSFSTALQEMAVETIFDYDTLADASKKMLAYGIEYENLLYIMKGITNFGAMSGDAAAMDRIALAIGQISTRGTLKAEEMRQLANAYVPIYDIIQDSFGLSGKEMGNVGNLNLPANEVIDAIVAYSEDRFGDVADAAMLTITGLKNRVVDTMKVLGSEMMQPLTTAWKSFLKFAADTLQEIRTLFNEGGWGNIFESLVPDPAMQATIRAFLANIHNLILSMVPVLSAIASIASVAGQALMAAFNVVAPIVTNVINVLANAVRMIFENAQAAYVLRGALAAAAVGFAIMTAQAVAAKVVTAITSAVYALSKALLVLSAIISSNWLVGGILLLVGGVATLAAVSNNANGSLSGLFKTLSGGTGGITQNDVLKRTNKDLNDGANAADAFNNKMAEGADAADDLADAVGGAGNAAKKAKAGLLAFDEVFRLNDPTGSAGSGGGAGGLGDFGDIEIPDFGGGGGGLGGLEIPSFGEYASNFVRMLKDSLLAKLATAGIGAAVASSIFRALGNGKFTKDKTAAALKLMEGIGKAIMGASVGLAFDAVASLITDKLWDALEGAFKLKDTSSEHASIGATIGSLIGGAIGFAVGGIKGSIVGSAIGHLAGGVVGLLWEEISGALSNTLIGAGTGIASAISKFFATSISQLPTLIMSGGFSGIFTTIGSMLKMTGLKAIAKGGIIGAAIGFVVDGLAALLWNTLTDKFGLSESAKDTAKVGQTIGSVIGTVIGGLLGGPPGALIGGAIGTFAAGFVGLFWERIVEFFQPAVDVFMSFATLVGSVLNTTANNLSSWISSTVEGFAGWFNDTLDGISNWWTDTTEGFSTWWNDTVAIFSDWDSITSETLSEWWTGTVEGFSKWVHDTIAGILGWGKDTNSSFTGWIADTKAGFDAWWSDTKAAFLYWAADVLLGIMTWVDDTQLAIMMWIDATLASIKKWATDTYNKFIEWVTNTATKIGEWGTKVAEVIAGFVIASAKAFGQWITDTINSVVTWGTNLYNSVYNWLFNTGAKIGGWLDKHFMGPIKSFFDADSMFKKISSALSDLKTKLSDWWKRTIKNIFSGNFNLGLSFNSEYTESKDRPGHAVGGVFNREHIARFAEGNKAEAIIPLETESAMQPFVDAVSNGLTEALAPLLANQGGGNADGLPPMYVGTLIADERGIKELYKRFEVIRVQENTRKGLANA